MLIPYNRTPRGLLDALDAQVGGKTPQQINDAVSGTFDCAEFWEAGYREVISGQTAALVLEGFFPVVTATLQLVPQNELWLVHMVTITNAGLALQAGTTVICAPAIQYPGAITFVLSEAFAFGATDRIFLPSERGRFIATPGTQFGIACNDVTLGVGPVGQVNLAFNRIRI